MCVYVVKPGGVHRSPGIYLTAEEVFLTPNDVGRIAQHVRKKERKQASKEGRKEGRKEGSLIDDQRGNIMHKTKFTTLF